MRRLTKGVEIDLPAGHQFHDKDGHARHNVRVRWWDASADTYRKAAIVDTLTRAEATRYTNSKIGVALATTAPSRCSLVIIGGTGFHSRFCPGSPAWITPHGKGGPLVAYRWEGEPSSERIISRQHRSR